MSDQKQLQTPEAMLERWSEWNAIQCSCDPDVGHLCEVCHDFQVMRNLIDEKAELLDALRKYVAFHKADHESLPAEELQAMYDAAVQNAAELLRKHGG